MSNKRKNTQTMVKISVLSAVSMILMLFQFPLPFAPPFLKVDLGDLPALIGGFAMGPIPGILIVFIKNILYLLVKQTSTAFVGEISNFIFGSVFVFVSTSIYFKNKSKKSAIIGLVFGVVSLTIIATISNYYVIFPLFAKMYHMPIDQIIEMGKSLNGYIVDYKTLMLFAVVPFNVVKGTLVSIVTILLYKYISPILHKKN